MLALDCAAGGPDHAVLALDCAAGGPDRAGTLESVALLSYAEDPLPLAGAGEDAGRRCQVAVIFDNSAEALLASADLRTSYLGEAP